MKKRTLTILVAALLAAAALPALAGVLAEPSGPIVQTSQMGRFDEGHLPRTAEATLVRHEDHVEVTVNTRVGGEMFVVDPVNPPGGFAGSEWRRGDATTLWFVLFNKPDACIDGCGVDEVIAALNGEDYAGVGLFYGAGSIATTGSWNTAAPLAEGDTTGLLIGEALADASATEIHVVVRSHGSARSLERADLTAALTSFAGGCDANVCGDVQDAVFAPVDN